MLIEMVLGLSLSLAADIDVEKEEADAEFNFYLREMVVHQMSADAPMAELIFQSLVDATFNTTKESIFRERIHSLQKTLQDHPDKADRFDKLDREFTRVFQKKVDEAKKKRFIYAISGAVIGAVVGIPVGKAISSTSKILFITIPAGALLGAGAGFLLGNLLAMPQYSYESGMVSHWDLKEIDDVVAGRSP